MAIVQFVKLEPYRVLVQKLHDDAFVPTRATNGSAGFDLAAYTPTKSISIPAGGFRTVHTGISVAILDSSWEMQVRSRSGLGAKEGLVIRQGVATFDSDYRGEVVLIMANHSAHTITINHGQRIAQAIFAYIWAGDLQVCDSLPPSARGAGGFGSTGK